MDTSIVDLERLYAELKELFLVLDEGDQFLFGQYGLSVTRFYALDHIKTTPGLTLRDLTDRLLCDKSNVTRLVKTLETNGYIERRAHETDGRSVRLHITPAGEKTHAEVAHAHETFNKHRFNGSAPDADLLPTLTDLKTTLINNLESAKSP